MPVVISLTTIPSRIEHILPCIDSLMQQGYPVFLWVARRETQRSGKVLEEIPMAILESGAHITIVDDRGPITKLLPALEDGYETIITADDDHTYGVGWANGLVEAAAEFPGSVVCYRGRIFDETRLYSRSKIIARRSMRADLVNGVCGALYKPAFFSDEIFSEWLECPLADDIVISSHLKHRNIPIQVVPTECVITRLQVAYTAPLADINVRQGQNDVGLERMFWK